jgi:hypothetical protein
MATITLKTMKIAARKAIVENTIASIDPEYPHELPA